MSCDVGGTAYIILKNVFHGCFFLVLGTWSDFWVFECHVMLVELWHCLHNPQKCTPWLFFPGVMGLSQIFEFLMMWQWHCCLHNPQKCVPWLFFLILSHPSFFPPHLLSLQFFFKFSSLWCWCKIVGTSVGVDESLGTWVLGVGYLVSWLSSLFFFSETLLLLLL